MNGTHRTLRWLWVHFLRSSGALWWAKRQLRKSGAIVVLLLHRVLEEDEWRQSNSLKGIAVRRRTFEDLADYLARRCDAVRLSEAAPGKAGSRIKIAVTFDDGWHDNYTTALPIAIQKGLPAVVFICTGLPGRVTPFWPERVVAMLRIIRPSAKEAEAEAIVQRLKSYKSHNGVTLSEHLAIFSNGRAPETIGFEGDRTMTWEEIAEMQRAGVAFGSHTHTHHILPLVDAEVAQREVRESRESFEHNLGKNCEMFAYPNGGWSMQARNIVEQEGIRLAFTAERRAWTEGCDRLLIPRANICETHLTGLFGRFSPAVFEYTTFWKVWRATWAQARSLASVKHSSTRLARI